MLDSNRVVRESRATILGRRLLALWAEALEVDFDVGYLVGVENGLRNMRSQFVNAKDCATALALQMRMTVIV